MHSTIQKKRLLLACDVGGTNVTVGVLEKKANQQYILLKAARYLSKEIDDLVRTLEKTIQDFHKTYPLTNDCPLSISACGPTDGEVCYPTNLAHWKIVRKVIEKRLSRPVLLINDFSAIAYSLMALDPNKKTQMQPLTAPARKKEAASGIKMVLGAGTGLGLAMLHIQQEKATLIPGEGGWRNFSPNNALSHQYYRFLSNDAKKLCCWEDAISGSRGIPSICRFFAEYDLLPGPLAPTPEEQRSLRKLLGRYSIDTLPAAISRLAHKNNSACEKIMNFWVTLYATFSCESASLTLPLKGVYIAGGIAAKNIRFFRENNRFIREFLNNQNKEVARLFRRIPLYVIVDYNSSLFGNAYIADTSIPAKQP